MGGTPTAPASSCRSRIGCRTCSGTMTDKTGNKPGTACNQARERHREMQQAWCVVLSCSFSFLFKYKFSSCMDLARMQVVRVTRMARKETERLSDRIKNIL